MVKVFRIGNAFNPQQDLRQTEVEAGTRLSNVGAPYMDEPWVCVAYLDGRRCFPTREEWRHIKLKDGDCVYFLPYVAGLETFIIVAIVAVAAVALALTFVRPPEVGQIPEPDDVFSLSGQRNQNRLGHPIEDGYGKMKLWPSYAARPYNQYIGNDQFQYQLFCLGHGSWDVTAGTDPDHGVFIEDTAIASFQETEHEIVLPGNNVTLFPTNVETSVEVTNLELIDTDGWHTFTANAANTDANRLEVDVVLPAGLYYANDSGGLDSKTVTLEFEYREIDDTGTPVGAGTWTTLNNFSKTLATNTPQRFTVGLDVTAARYEVRGRRTDTKDTSHRAGHSAHWAGMRAFKTETRNYGDVTLLAVKARATNNLNDKASNRINVVATRMLPDWDGGAGTLADWDDTANRTASRNPVWAFANILRTEYAAGLADTYLDLSFFATEASAADTAGITFDHVFGQRTTVWEAAKACLFVWKAVPMLKGSLVTLSRDKPTSVPSFYINPENTVAGSFKLIHRLHQDREYDGLDVEYLDATTWKEEVVECRLAGDSGDHPKTIKLRGVTSRQNAFDLGMYLWTKERDERQEIHVTTGLEGYIPTFNDLGRFGSDIPKWGTNGYVKDITGSTITLSEDVTFEVGPTYKIALRGKEGQHLGPYTVTAGSAANIVVSSDALPAGEFFFDGNQEPPYFIFGKSTEEGRIARIVRTDPVGDGQVKLTAVVDDQGRFTDPGTAPALGTEGLPPVAPSAPAVDGLTVEAVPGALDRATARWLPAYGATHYLLQTSPNGTDWTELGAITETYREISIIPGETLYVRVAAVNVGIGAWDTWNGALGDFGGVPYDVDGLEVNPAFTGRSVNIIWKAAPGATSYEVKVKTGGTLRATLETVNTSLTYTIDDAIGDSAVARSIDFEVKGKNATGTSATADTVTATNTKPAAPANPSSTETMDVTDFKEFRISFDEVDGADVKFYRIWASTTSGFTPGSSNLVYEGLGRTFDIRLKKTGGSITTTYWKAAAVDVWDDTDYNTTAEQTIS